MSKIIEQAQKTVAECEEQVRKINAAETKIEDRERLTKTQLAKTKDQIAKALVCELLGETTTVEVADLRRQKAMFQQFLEDAPLILQQLKARKDCIAPQMHEAERTLNQFERYKSLKRQLEAGHGGFATQNDLRDYARALGLEEDCERFLKENAT